MACLCALAAACAPTLTRGGAYISVIRPELRPPPVWETAGADSLWGPKEASSTGDGIADARRADLQQLVERFSPSLVLPKGDHARVGDQRFWMVPTNVSLYTKTLRLDLIKAAPYEYGDSSDIAMREIGNDSLAYLVELGRIYRSDPVRIGYAYYNFPGSNPREWWAHYGRLRTGPDSARWARPTVYAHPFTDPKGRLAIQYWFFYPFNDFVANHEGDWEHIIVVVKPDRKTIDQVQYYMHQRSLILPSGTLTPELVDDTHPVVYVGGRMYHVLDFPIRLLNGDHNEGSHGSFPHPGEWEGVAGMGGSESVLRVDKDSLRAVPYGRFDVILTPEPTRVQYDRVPEVLREWIWLMLPVRWGFPVSVSAGSGLRPDVGNWAPWGPAFSTAWNRGAPGLLFPEYKARKLPVLRSFLEDLMQPWYYLYAFRTPRYIHDTRDTVSQHALERLDLVPHKGGAENGVGTTAMGMSFGFPRRDLANQYSSATGFLVFHSLWAKLRLGAVELTAGYQQFRSAADTARTLFVYPLTASVVARGEGNRFRPYLGAGAGLYGWQSRRQETTSRSYLASSGWSVGWNAQMGLEYYLRPRVALDIGLRLHETKVNGSAAGLGRDRLRFFTLWVGHYLRF